MHGFCQIKTARSPPKSSTHVRPLGHSASPVQLPPPPGPLALHAAAAAQQPLLPAVPLAWLLVHLPHGRQFGTGTLTHVLFKEWNAQQPHCQWCLLQGCLCTCRAGIILKPVQSEASLAHLLKNETLQRERRFNKATPSTMVLQI
eukprot:1136861-Pelagomonas_calceolata.AAC.5